MNTTNNIINNNSIAIVNSFNNENICEHRLKIGLLGDIKKSYLILVR